MKIVVGIVLIVLVIGALALYLILMLNAHDMIFCGDIINENGRNADVTRVYTSDLIANETLSEIVAVINETDSEDVSVEELTVILAEFQSVIYAPVFLFDAEKVDTSTFVVTGSVYNGINEKGEPTTNDYLFDNLRLNVVIENGMVLAAQNVYPEIENSKGEEAFVQRNSVIEPLITDEGAAAAFAFEDTDSFRFIVKGTEDVPAKITFIYTYDITTENPLDFTGSEDGVLGVTMTVAYDEDGLFDPTYEIVKNIEVTKEKKR